MKSAFRSNRTVAAVAALCVAFTPLLLNGCVERRLMIRSEPAGADIVVNGRHVGIAPVNVPFDTYGTFEVMATHPGRKRLRTAVEARPPWWQYLPLDLLVEHVWPFTVQDEQEFTVALDPVGSADDPSLEQREKELRERVEMGGVK